MKTPTELTKCFTYFDELMLIIGDFQDAKSTHEIKKQLALFREELHATLTSFHAKNSLKSKAIIKSTQGLIKEVYYPRLHNICASMIENINGDSQNYLQNTLKLQSLKLLIVEKTHHTSDVIKKDVFLSKPLLFSQNGCNRLFSRKKSRPGVSGEDLKKVATSLKNGDLNRDEIWLEVYRAPFKGNIQAFAFNNRTWAAFSKAKVLPNRVVVKFPTQACLNRIESLQSDAKTVRIEGTRDTVTTLRP